MNSKRYKLINVCSNTELPRLLNQPKTFELKDPIDLNHIAEQLDSILRRDRKLVGVEFIDDSIVFTYEPWKESELTRTFQEIWIQIFGNKPLAELSYSEVTNSFSTLDNDLKKLMDGYLDRHNRKVILDKKFIELCRKQLTESKLDLDASGSLKDSQQ